MNNQKTVLMELLLKTPIKKYPPTLYGELLEVTKSVGFSGGVLTDVIEMWMQDLTPVEVGSYIKTMQNGGY